MAHVPARQLMAAAFPTVSTTHIQASLRSSIKSGLGRPLPSTDRGTLNAGKRNGVLHLTHPKSGDICTAYMRYCWAVQRPYVVVDNYGAAVHVDASPVAGASSTPQAPSVERLLAAWGKELAKVGASVSNTSTVKAQPSKLLPGPLEGSNNYGGKVADTALTPHFMLHTVSRADALEKSALLYAAYCTAFGLLQPADTAALRVQAKQHQDTLQRKRMLRRLRHLEAAVTAGQVTLRTRQGVLAGFRASQQQR